MGIRVGVLAIQGDFQSHINVLNKIGVESVEIRTEKDLNGVSHLIIPGGESTAIRKVIENNGLWNKIASFSGPVMGTCMGSILMGNKVESPAETGWGMIEFTAIRNAYGRQINSFVAEGKTDLAKEPFEMVFIRAPKFSNLGKNVKPFAWLGDEITGIVSGNKIAVTFHPELTESTIFHEYLLSL
jgi:5'-phosphate synthase pdxT subunit